MSSDGRYDLIVVGLGGMGAATLFHAARLGLRVLGIDRFDPPHQFGSSHAETRVTRLAVGEGPQYLPFAKRSHEIWRELEAETGRELLYESGCCIITARDAPDQARWNDFVTATAEVADAGGIDFRQLSSAELRAEQPAIKIGDNERAGLEPTGGIVMAERAVAIQLELARAAGAEVRANEPVLSVDPDHRAVTVTTAAGSYRAERVVAATGAWLPELAAHSDAEAMTVTRQVVYWFEVEDPAAFSVERFPAIIWVGRSIEEYIGAFPMPPGGIPGMKILGEQFGVSCEAATVDRTVSEEEIAAFHRKLVAPRLEGVTSRCVQAAVCLYTNTPDDHFLIDTDPRSDRVIVMSPCSGHGFKHSTALGEAVAQWVSTGHSTLDLSPFKRRW